MPLFSFLCIDPYIPLDPFSLPLPFPSAYAFSVHATSFFSSFLPSPSFPLINEPFRHSTALPTSSPLIRYITLTLHRLSPINPSSDPHFPPLPLLCYLHTSLPAPSVLSFPSLSLVWLSLPACLLINFSTHSSSVWYFVTLLFFSPPPRCYYRDLEPKTHCLLFFSLMYFLASFTYPSSFVIEPVFFFFMSVLFRFFLHFIFVHFTFFSLRSLYAL